MSWRIGTDIGGTFTDLAMVEADTGCIAIAKLATTPHDFGQAVVDGIRRGLRDNAIDPATGRRGTGGAARLMLIPPRGNARRLNSKGGFVAPVDALVVGEAPGSGGYGPPAGRDPTALADDLQDGYVSAAAARRDYGTGAA